MGINKKLNSLFKEYKSQRNFFRDGVFNESKFKSSKVKILFLLKEINGNENDSWDLREIVKDNTRSATWINAGKIHYILNNNYPHYNNILNLNEQEITQSINSIASINLSKKAGKGKANYSRIYKEATDKFRLWKTQIDIINPDIVICGGTFDIVQELFEKNKIIDKKEIKETSNGMNYFYHNKMPFIDFVHPAFFGRCRLSFGYSFLKGAIKITSTGKIARL